MGLKGPEIGGAPQVWKQWVKFRTNLQFKHMSCLVNIEAFEKVIFDVFEEETCVLCILLCSRKPNCCRIESPGSYLKAARLICCSDALAPSIVNYSFQWVVVCEVIHSSQRTWCEIVTPISSRVFVD